ncbi:MAG: hypothetical protein IB618_02310 [Candidatus Pacearchaeota archaeon]|nr:MAG: hypothetical protein IB618_02310 [Candidatus Pacearchaeota archaeon]
MRWNYLIFVMVFIFLLCIPNVNALECISLNTAKSSYLPEETVQIEVDADTIRTILASDIFFYKDGTRLPINIFISKVTETKYFVWFDLPTNSGNYILKVRGNCRDGSLYVADIPIVVEEIVGSHYESLKQKVEGKWSTLSLENHILSAGALSYVLAEESLIAYIERTDSCMNQECNTKFKALSLIAFEDGFVRQRMQDSIDASQNYVKGLWKLEIESSIAQQCDFSLDNKTLSINLVTGENSFDLTFENIEADELIILVDCRESISGKITYSYKDFSKEYETEPGQNLSFSINNKGCWGIGLRTGCDSESTAYALLSLAMAEKLNKENKEHAAAISWLKENAVSVKEKVISYYLTEDPETLSWILNLQTMKGWWPKDVQTYEQDIETTSIVIFVLKESNYTGIVEKAKTWLLGQDLPLNKEALMLVFAFQSKDIEPLLAFWPGIIKTESMGTFDLILLNKGTIGIILNTELLNSTTATILPTNSVKNVKFNIPRITTIDGRTISENLVIDYKQENSLQYYSYSVPILIFTEKSSREGMEGEVNASEQEVNETEQQEIINETEYEWENKTTELNESLIQRRFKFVEGEINKTVDISEGTSTISIRLENKLDRDISDVSITYSSSLIGVVERINPSFLEEISEGEKESITITITPTAIRVYEGYIIADAKYDSKTITTKLPLNINVSGIAAEKKNCSDIGGKICEEDEICEGTITEAADTFSCCIPADACKKKPTPGRTIGVIIVLAIALILIVLFFILRKRSRKEMKKFLEKSAKQYEKKFQRPASIKR